MLEKQLILYCSPTLAGLKSAGLFTMVFNDDVQKKNAEEQFKHRFSHKGISLKWLGIKNGRTLVYIYRKNKLTNELQDTDTKNFLIRYGYDTSDVDNCLEMLKMRISQRSEFPHEIGIFLGYPLEDVKGFINNKGRNYRFAGAWKIYGNEKDTLRLFEKFTHCTEMYSRLYVDGRPIEKLAVRC